MADEGRGSLQSVRRAMRTLELIAEAGDIGVSELGRRLGVHKATASRLAATLAQSGVIERDPVTDRYCLGYGLIRLASAATTGMDIVATARPLIEELAERSRETVSLGVRAGDGVVYVGQASSTRSIVSVNWVGQRTPMHASASGKVPLAFMDEAERSRLLTEPLVRTTPRTIVDHDALEAELREVRRRGYAQILEELEEGLNAVAVPIRRADELVVAALSVSGPAFRFRPIDVPRLGRLALDAATAISRRLGYQGRTVY
jgi:DNA-binding IclR family transcriptional regulator